MTTTPITRVKGSFAICPVGLLTGKVGGDICDGDSLRSGLLSDGRVENIFNGFSQPLPDNCKERILKQPQGIRDLVASLISSERLSDATMRLTAVGNQLDGRDVAEVGSQLALNDVDASVLDINSVAFTGATCLESLRITYGGNVDDVLAVKGQGSDDGNVLNSVEAKRAPACIALAAQKLVAAGFSTVAGHFDGASLRTISFVKGGGSRSIRAELTWIV